MSDATDLDVAARDHQADPSSDYRGKGNPLVRFAIHRRVTMCMVIVGLMVMGWLSLTRLPLEFLPAVSLSNVSVTVSLPSASPEEVAQRIIRPLEDSLGTLQNLDRLSAIASADSGRLNVGFVDGTDMDWAAVEVRDRVDRVRHLLPDDVRRIRIRRFQTSDLPVMRFDLSADWSREELFDFAERVMQRRLERLEGVAQAQIRGLRTRQVLIKIDADRMAAHNVDVRTLQSTLRRNHLDVSAGHIDEGSKRMRVRLLGRLRGLEEIRRLPITGTTLTLSDLAEVTYDFPRQDDFNFLNGQETLNVRVYKASDANLLQVVERVKAELALLASEPQWRGHRARIFQDASEDVRKGLAQLRNAGLLGGGLAVLAVFFFLRRLRTTLLVGIAIPVSVVFTFVLIFLIRQAGWSTITLNVVSLMGLVLALGMLVDSSIVVIEAIYRRIEHFGEDSVTAALRGASDVALPIVASTITTLCVFVPVIFLGSSAGFFSRYLVEVGTTICIVMIASLLVALTVVPMAAALLLTHEKPASSRLIKKLESVYGGVLRITLRFRFVGLLLALGMLWGSWNLFGSIERSFAGRTQERQVEINIDTPRNYTLEQTAALFSELRGILMAHKEELDVADITSSYSRSGGRSRRSFNGRREIELHLKDESVSRLTTTEVRDRVRELLPTKAGVDLRIGQARRRGGGGGVELELSGSDPKVLELMARQIADRMSEIPGLDDVDLSLENGNQELLVKIGQGRALQAGLSTQAVAQTVQTALSDRSVSYLSSDEREIELMMLFREDDEATFGQLRNAEVFVGEEAVPLGSLAEFKAVPGPRSIERENRLAQLTITTNTDDPRAMGRAMGAVGRIMADIPLPPGYSWSFGRWNRMSQQDQQGSDFALIFALILVYMLMASLFESFTHPFSIMMAVPFAFIGVGVVMKLAGQPRDNFTQLGFIVLVGVVVNNAIVLVDHINRLRSEGMDRRAAILQGGRDRLRAILMTAVTTIVGLLPMVAPILLPQYFGTLEGRAATWAPVGLVILGGLTTSTFLTLLIVPTFYSVVDDMARFFQRVMARALATSPRDPEARPSQNAI